MAVETQQVIQREAPEVEAYNLGLLESAKKLADQRITVPKPMVAGMSGLQDAALTAASPASGGIGGYQQFIQGAKTTMDQVPGMVTSAVGDAGTVYRTGASGVRGNKMSQYMNPYQQAVFDEINRSFDTQCAQAGLQ